MPHDRFYTPLPLSLHEPLTLEGEEAAHLKVMRIREGETIELINGKGKLAKAKVIEIKRREAELKVENVEEREKLKPCLILAQALPRLNRLEVILEKGTELGADTFWLFPGEKSEKGHLTDAQLKRLEKITISAMKQCGRLYLPEIILMPPLKKWSSFPKGALFGDMRESAPLLKDALPKGGEATFFTGPEAGFIEEEVTLLEKTGAQGVSLHPLTLRTDTASLTALSLLYHLNPTLSRSVDSAL